MILIFIRAGALIAVIIAGYLLKKAHFFKLEDFPLLSKIVICLTLPCAVINNFSTLTIQWSLLILFFLGIGGNLIMIGLSFLYTRGKDGSLKGFCLLNQAGYNIGTFAMPFVQSFLPPMGVAAACLFDSGNAVMCTGLNYTIAAAVSSKEKPRPGKILKSLFSSAPFVTYLVMLTLTYAQIRLPEPVLTFTGIVGSANSFMAMLAIGVGFELKFNPAYLKRICKYLASRYSVAAILAALVYFFFPASFPASQEIKTALMLMLFAPLSALAPAFTGRIRGDIELSSTINSFSIVCSIICMTLIMLLML